MAPHHLQAAPQPLETLGGMEAEAVEMIDQEDAGLHRAASADASAIRTADALRRVSSASRIGSESCTTPAPARTHACPSRTTAERMMTALSIPPVPCTHPMAPPQGHRLVAACYPTCVIACRLGAPASVPAL